MAARATRCGVHVRRIHGHIQTVNSIELDFGVSASWVSIAAPTRENAWPPPRGRSRPAFPPRGIYKSLMRLISGACPMIVRLSTSRVRTVGG